MKLSVLLNCFLLLFILFGCTKVVSKYQTSNKSLGQLKSLSSTTNQKIAFNDFTVSQSRIDMGCRAISIVLQENTKVEKYVRDAFVAELQGGNMYSESSAKRLDANIDQVTLSTFSAAEIFIPMYSQLAGESKWTIGMTFKGDGIEPFSISLPYSFKSIENTFDDGCERAANKFGNAVGNFITIFVNHPSFTEFLTK